MPVLSARVRVELGAAPDPSTAGLRGSPDEIARGIRAYAEAGVSHIALAFPEPDPAGLTRSVERFVSDVRPLLEA